MSNEINNVISKVGVSIPLLEELNNVEYTDLQQAILRASGLLINKSLEDASKFGFYEKVNAGRECVSLVNTTKNVFELENETEVSVTNTVGYIHKNIFIGCALDRVYFGSYSAETTALLKEAEDDDVVSTNTNSWVKLTNEVWIDRNITPVFTYLPTNGVIKAYVKNSVEQDGKVTSESTLVWLDSDGKITKVVLPNGLTYIYDKNQNLKLSLDIHNRTLGINRWEHNEKLDVWYPIALSNDKHISFLDWVWDETTGFLESVVINPDGEPSYQLYGRVEK